MSNSRALVEHIEAINSNSQEWVAKDPEYRIASMLVTIPDHWADYNVYTPAEFDRYTMEQDYITLHKDVYGTRPRMIMDSVSDGRLVELVDALSEQLEAQMEDLREYEYAIDTEFEHAVIEWYDAKTKADNEANSFGTKYDEIQEVFDASAEIKRVLH